MNARRARLVFGVAVFSGALAALFVERSREAPRRTIAHALEPAVVEVRAQPVAARRPTIVPERVVQPMRTAESSDDVPVMGAHGDDSERGARHPHPITPEHERIFKENTLLAAMNGAMDLGSGEALREFNQRYREEFPEDEQALQPGYALIADCLERSDDDTRARARRYFEEERASTLRRYVKRYCLD